MNENPLIEWYNRMKRLTELSSVEFDRLKKNAMAQERKKREEIKKDAD